MRSIGDQLRAIAAKSEQKFEKVYRGTMQEMGRRIILRSPIDTGAFRANWLADFVKDNSYDYSRTDIGYSEGRMTAKVNQLRTNQKFYFVNSLPYSETLENGNSAQAPSGMVKLTAAEFESIASAEIARVS